ncbi:MAG: hypothetical protein ACO3NK_08615 [Prochlorotrichaceae cyanobacterium]|jgi:hypothetical protein
MRQRLIFTLKTVLVLLSSLLIWGCSGNFVSQSIVREGISLYLDYTQTALSEALDLTQPDFQVQGITIEDQQVFLHDRLPTYHVQGNYTLRLKFPNQTLTQSGNPFDLYLQEQAENKTWRLLLPASADSDNLDLWQSLLVTPEH